MGIHIEQLDHLVLTVRDVGVTCAFYERVLGMEVITFQGDRKALRFGTQKLNLHPAGGQFLPVAELPTPGSADLCLIAETPLEQVVTHLGRCGVQVEMGPIRRTGATGPLHSVYVRDPDGNLIEISNRA